MSDFKCCQFFNPPVSQTVHVSSSSVPIMFTCTMKRVVRKDNVYFLLTPSSVVNVSNLEHNQFINSEVSHELKFCTYPKSSYVTPVCGFALNYSCAKFLRKYQAS